MKNLIHTSWSMDQDLNPQPTKYKAGVPTTAIQCLIHHLNSIPQIIQSIKYSVPTRTKICTFFYTLHHIMQSHVLNTLVTPLNLESFA
jgi:hypothetical protein